MSHFAVIVVGPDIDYQLEPYKEEVEPGSEWAEFHDNTEEAQEKYRKLKKTELKEYPTFESFCQHYLGYTEEDGAWGYWSNPQAKWDWYTVGGRWHGFFWAKKGALSGKSGERSWTNAKEQFDPRQCDSIIKKDIDLEAMREFDRGQWQLNYIEAMKMDNPGSREFIYGVKPDETLEQFMARREESHPCATFAVLWRGEWIEKGSMGWWGMVSDEKEPKAWNEQFEALWAKIPNNARLTVVDCHI